VEKYASKYSLPYILKENLTTAVSAAKMLGFETDLNKIQGLNLKGRFEKIAQNITIDVGHNIGAANAAAKIFSGKKVILVYNSYKDKNYNYIIKILTPIVKSVEIIDLTNPYRADAKNEIRKVLIKQGVDVKDFGGINQDNEYLVFGSFGVAEKFLRYFNEK
jgi:dihydrofolate synthase/folylpolyglutamate synthase